MTREEIAIKYKTILESAAMSFKGEKVTDATKQRLQHALQDAITKEYENIPMAYVEHYMLMYPKIEVKLDRGEAVVSFTRGEP